jgi:hypothetical protein
VLLVTASAALVSWFASGWKREYRDAMQLVALGGLAYLVPVAFEGVWVVTGWAVLAVAFAALPRRVVILDGLAPAAFVALASAHTLLVEAPPLALRDGVDDLASTALAIASTTVAAFVAARRSPEPLAWMLTLTGAAGAIYLPSIAIVDLTSTDELAPGQTPQVLLSAFWSAVGLRRDRVRPRARRQARPARRARPARHRGGEGHRLRPVRAGRDLPRALLRRARACCSSPAPSRTSASATRWEVRS